MSVLGEKYDELLEQDKALREVMQGFDAALEFDPTSKLARNGSLKFENELIRNIETRIEYLKMVEPVIESAYDNEDLSEWFYDRFKAEQVKLDEELESRV